MASERDDGFYWVLDSDGDWEVAKWSSHWSAWFSVGTDEHSPDSAFRRIGPRCYSPPERAKRSAEEFVAELKAITEKHLRAQHQ